MGRGTKESPYTRKDVLRRIRNNGGTAKGLDLSGKVFEQNIDLRDQTFDGIILNGSVLENCCLERANLSEANLKGAKLRHSDLKGAFLAGSHLEGADLIDTNLEEAFLVSAHLEGAKIQCAHLEKAMLQDANLKRADLIFTHLEGAYLTGSHLEETYLTGVKLSSETNLENVDWGDYILGEERERLFDIVSDTYRQLKMWHTNAGMYDVAGEFYFREMTAKRKMIKWRPNPLPRAWSKFLSLICGYGEKPLRVIGWAASVVLASALIYFLIGSVWEWAAFWRSLYFSAVSFTALGYGSWLTLGNDLASDFMRGLGAFESFIGVFSIALFLVTFTRKMTR